VRFNKEALKKYI
jgi:hypothetical protein